MSAPRYTAHVETLTDPELVELALAKWGGPVEAFADQVVRVNPVTLLRWRKGESRLNRRRRQWFIHYLTGPARRRPQV